MKKTLGRGLSQLMQGNAPKNASDTRSEAAPVSQASPKTGGPAMTGMSRLMQGQTKPVESSSEPVSVENPFMEGADPGAFAVRRVPDWIFYLGDVVLLSAVVWMTILRPTAPTAVEWGTSLFFTVVAALIGIYPWMRNVMGADASVRSGDIPRWSLAHQAQSDGSEKTFVMHHHEPYAAVEITETSWSGVQTKPIWLTGIPDISPDDMKRLLLGAAEFYKQQRHRSPHGQTAFNAA